MTLTYDLVYGKQSMRGHMDQDQRKHFCSECGALDITVKSNVCDTCVRGVNNTKKNDKEVEAIAA
jgi:hypothetical protein